MELVCSGFEVSGAAQRPAEQQAQVMSAWMRANVTNPEILRVVDNLALDTWASARERLAALATQHGVEPCALAQSDSQQKLPIELPQLAGPGSPDISGELVVVSPGAITIDGATVVTLDHGRLKPSEVSAHVVRPLAKLIKGVTSATPVRIAFDRTIPVATALPVIATVAAGGEAKVLIVCEQNHGQVLLPVWIALRNVDIKYVVTAGRDTLRLARWENGKPGATMAEAPLDAGVGQMLRAIAVEKAHAPPPASPSPVLLVLDPTLDVDRFVALVGALGSLMTSVVLSPGAA
jgi:hypothetical protein